MIELTIDRVAVEVPDGTTIWEAARSAGIEIPVLCHEPRMKPVGVCRMCVVDVGGRTATAKDLAFYHLHVDNRYAEQDPNCAFPLTRLAELEQAGEIGRSAPSHYSYMGYILDPEVLLEQSTPEMIRRMQSEQVDVVLLVPF